MLLNQTDLRNRLPRKMWLITLSLLLLALGIRYNYAIVCESTLMVKTICPMSNVPMLDILPAIRSKLECAVACSQDDACKSSVFGADGVCRTYSDYAMYVECASEKFYMPVYESSCHVPPITLGPIHSYCKNDTDCSVVPQSECRATHTGNRCQCDPGLSYSPSTDECVIDCPNSNYSSEFQADKNHVLVAFSDKGVPGDDLEACMNACVTEIDFVCRSIEIWRGGNYCFLSRDTAGTQPQAREANSDYDLYQRDCAPYPIV